jgi:hypothetical protein
MGKNPFDRAVVKRQRQVHDLDVPAPAG